MNNARVKDPKKKQGTKTEKWKNGNNKKKKDSNNLQRLLEKDESFTGYVKMKT